jgi:thiamine-phosphate pyrophosphorylase
MAEIPAGVWAIASELCSAELADWIEYTRAASARSFRLPAANEQEAVAMLRELRRHTTWLAIHARSDWALLCGADGVVAGSRSLPPEVLRRQLKPTMALGMPDHNPQEAAHALRCGADFLVCSPIWDTPSKRGILAPRGLPALAQASQVAAPVYALGGIETPEQVVQCKAAGATGVWVLRAAKDPVLFSEMVAAWAEEPAV